MMRRQSGSLLVEVSLVMMAMGVLALVSFAMLSGTKKHQDQAAEGNSLMIAEQAVRTFVLREKRLPCPDPTGSGFESRDPAGLCPAGMTTGYLPFATLQLEKPAIGGLVRYGVWRQAGMDLANLVAPPPGDGSLDAASQLLDAMALALKNPLTTGLPYVAQLNDKNQHVDCAQAFDNPAFVLAVQPTGAAGPGAGSPVCFADDPATGAKVLSVGRQELLGWAKARFSG